MSLDACAPITSGSEFLRGSLAWLDCAGRTIGSSGYMALSQPGSIPSQLVLAAITLFIAFQGIRMMYGKTPDIGDAVMAVAKIGLILMLVTSWPAVRTLFASPAFNGPAEIVAQTAVGGSTALEDRLQRVDDGIVTLTKWGSGKLDIQAGQTADGQPAATEFSGIALTDNLALGLGRLCYLMGALTSFGLLRLLTGVMITALPIFAGFVLFDATRGLFWGWVRTVFGLFVAGIAIPLILAAEVSLIEPWLAGAIEARSSTLATPSAPTELLAISGSFLLILFGAGAIIAKSCFAVDVAGIASRIERWREAEVPAGQDQRVSPDIIAGASGYAGLSRGESLALSIQRIDHLASQRGVVAGSTPLRIANNDRVQSDIGRPSPAAGTRRARQRLALSHARRNQS